MHFEWNSMHSTARTPRMGENGAPRNKWDLIGSILLLIVAVRLIFVLGYLLVGIVVLGGYTQSQSGDASWIGWAVASGLVLPTIVAAVPITIVRIVKRRPAWWVVMAADALGILVPVSIAAASGGYDVLFGWLFLLGTPFGSS